MLLIGGGLLAAFPSIRATASNLWLQAHDAPSQPATLDELMAKPGKIYALGIARDRFDAPIAVPQIVPEGYELIQGVELKKLGQSMRMAGLAWQKQGAGPEAMIYLQIIYMPDGAPDPAETLKDMNIVETDLNGKRGIIVRGNSQGNGQTVTSEVQLVWQYNQQTIYYLSANTDFVSLDDLMRMALTT